MFSLKWTKGRINSGYYKFLVYMASWPIPFDIYILKFPTGSDIRDHVDTVEEGNHYRLNITLKKADEGGVFKCGAFIFETDRIKLFRPDIYQHHLTKITKGSQYMLSIGWIRPIVQNKP